MRIVFWLFFVCVFAFSEQQKVFGTNPQITVLLEILYPQGLIGLNYKPYEEDLEFMPTSVRGLPVLGGIMGGGREMKFEKIIALKPDILFFSKTAPQNIVDSYQNAGIKVVLLDMENTKQSIQDIGKSLKIQERSQKLLDFIEKNTLKISQKNLQKIPNVYFAQGNDGLETSCASKESDLAQEIGGKNVLECANGFQRERIKLNFEKLALLNPDAIFVREIGLFKELRENPNASWKKLKAVQEGKVFYAPSTPSNWLMRPPSVLQVIGKVWAFSKLHPEILSEEEAKGVAQEFFAEFLTPLSDEKYREISGLE